MKSSTTQTMQERFLEILRGQIESIHQSLQNADPNDPHTVKLHRLLLGYMREYRQMDKHMSQKNETAPDTAPKPNGKNTPKPEPFGNGKIPSKQEMMQDVADRIWDESGKKEPVRRHVSTSTALLAKPQCPNLSGSKEKRPKA